MSTVKRPRYTAKHTEALANALADVVGLAIAWAGHYQAIHDLTHAHGSHVRAISAAMHALSAHARASGRTPGFMRVEVPRVRK